MIEEDPTLHQTFFIQTNRKCWLVKVIGKRNFLAWYSGIVMIVILQV